MATQRQRSQAASTLSNSKRRRAQERTRLQVEQRNRLLRRLALVAAPLAVLLAIASYVWRASNDSLAGMMLLDSSTASGTGMAWSPDGARLALNGEVAGRDVSIWDTRSGKLLHRVFGDGRLTDDVAWSPDGTLLAVAAEPDALKGRSTASLLELWRTTDWTPVPGTRNLGALAGQTARRLAFSPNGSRLAAYNDSTLVLLSVPGLRRLATARLSPGQGSAPAPLDWSPDGSLLAAGVGAPTGQGSTALDILDGRTLAVLRTLTIGGTFPTTLVGAAAWSPRGTQVALAGLSGVAAVYDARFGRKLRSLDHALNSIDTLAWSPDGRRLAAGGNNGLVIWDAATGHVLQQRDAPVDVPGSNALLNTVERLAWSPDGSRIAVSGDNAVPSIWSPPQVHG